MDDVELADRLNAAWDELIDGNTPLSRRLEGELGQQLREMVGIHKQLSPKHRFVDQLGARLMAGMERSVPIIPIATQAPTQSTPAPGREVRRGRRQASPVSISSLTTAAMVVIVLIAGLAVFQSGPDGPGQRGLSEVSAPVASPEPDPNRPVRFDECSGVEKTEEEIAALIGEPGTVPEEVQRLIGRGGFSGPGGLGDLPAWPAAEDATVAELNAQVRQLTACLFYRAPFVYSPGGPMPRSGRFYSLFTDDFLRRLNRRDPLAEAIDGVRPALPHPVTVEAAMIASDGRVLAVVRDHPLVDTFGDWRSAVLFARVGDQWLIDALIWMPSGDPSAAATIFPTEGHSESPPALGTLLGVETVVFTQEEPGYEPYHGSMALYDGWEALFVFANPTSDARRIQVPGQGIDVSVPRFETRWISVRLVAGEHRFTVFSDGLPMPPAPPPCEGLPYPDNVMVVYEGPVLNDLWDCGRG
jgi:hypothetical protein